jgi:glycosyltransferase involved in cell wall biosynthesis
MNMKVPETKLTKVIIVGPLPPPAGGMANQTQKLAELLTAQGLTVNIIVVNGCYRPAWVAKLKGIRAIFRLFFYLIALWRGIQRGALVHVMANSGWSWHLYAVPAIVIGRLKGCAVLLNYRGGYAADFFARSWSTVKLSLDLVQGVMVPSVFLQEVFASYQKKVHVVPNVLDTKLFCQGPRIFAQDGLHLVITRNLEAIYGVATVLEAFAIVCRQHSRARLSIAGSGPERKALEQQVRNLALADNVTFTGRLCPEEMAALYQSADIMLNASTVDNTPNSIIESLACATLVVSTDVGGIPKLVKHQFDALLVPVNDSVAMARQILMLVDHQQLRNKLIKNGLNTVQKFDWHCVWQKLSRCYCQAQLDNQHKVSKYK